RGEALAVRAEGHGADVAAVPAEGEDFPAAPRVPDPHGPIRPRRGEAPAVRAEPRAPDVAHVSPESHLAGMSEALEVVPFPVSEGRRALDEKLLGPAQVIGLPAAPGQGNAIEVET